MIKRDKNYVNLSLSSSQNLPALRDPVLRFLDKLNDLRALKAMMHRKHFKEIIAKFISVICMRD